MNDQRTSYSVRHKCLSKQHVSLDSDQLSCGKKNWAHIPTAVGLMASHKAVRPAQKHFVVCFDNIISNAFRGVSRIFIMGLETTGTYLELALSSY